MELARLLPLLLLSAWLLPLGSFAAIVFAGPRMGRGGRKAAYLATGAIGAALVLSLAALGAWLWHHPLAADSQAVAPLSGDWYTLAEFGKLRLAIGYYIDALTLGMFVMVTLISTCIHVYSIGYMREELGEVTDPLVRGSDGGPLVRPGRFPRFFQYLSLFCFSMLGLVVAGNIAMVFVFWELVGICSYLLIGFYIERRSASTAANKAFLVNRVGDFGMIVGIMILLGGLGTFAFGDHLVRRGRSSRESSARCGPPARSTAWSCPTGWCGWPRRTAWPPSTPRCPARMPRKRRSPARFPSCGEPVTATGC